MTVQDCINSPFTTIAGAINQDTLESSLRHYCTIRSRQEDALAINCDVSLLAKHLLSFNPEKRLDLLNYSSRVFKSPQGFKTKSQTLTEYLNEINGKSPSNSYFASELIKLAAVGKPAKWVPVKVNPAEQFFKVINDYYVYLCEKCIIAPTEEDKKIFVKRLIDLNGELESTILRNFKQGMTTVHLDFATFTTFVNQVKAALKAHEQLWEEIQNACNQNENDAIETQHVRRFVFDLVPGIKLGIALNKILIFSKALAELEKLEKFIEVSVFQSLQREFAIILEHVCTIGIGCLRRRKMDEDARKRIIAAYENNLQKAQMILDNNTNQSSNISPKKSRKITWAGDGNDSPLVTYREPQ